MQEEDILKLEGLIIEPNNCPLSAPLNISMKYTLIKPVPGATWEVVYEADYTNKRKAIALHTTAPADLQPGTHQFTHTIPEIKTGDIKEKYLLQVGVLKLTLKGGGGSDNLAVVNMVTQVMKGDDGVLTRMIMNPIEE